MWLLLVFSFIFVVHSNLNLIHTTYNLHCAFSTRVFETNYITKQNHTTN
jgi:hypothetical protein